MTKLRAAYDTLLKSSHQGKILERVHFLRSLPVFHSWPQPRLVRLSTHILQRSVPPNTAVRQAGNAPPLPPHCSSHARPCPRHRGQILSQGAAADRVLIVQHGSVKVSREIVFRAGNAWPVDAKGTRESSNRRRSMVGT